MSTEETARESAPTSQDAAKKPRFAVLQSLQSTPFRFLLVNNGFAMTGFHARLMAQAWLVLEMTNSDAWVGAVNGLPAIPVIFLTLFGGVLADRMDRRVLLIISRAIMASIALLTAFLITSGVITVWHLMALAFFITLTHSFGMILNQTLLAGSVDRERLFSANAMLGASMQFGLIVGPAIGGVLIARIGVDAAFYLTAAMLVIAALAAYGVRVNTAGGGRRSTSILRDFRDGFDYISSTPTLRWLFVMGLGVLFAAIWVPLIPRFARDILQVGPEGYGSIIAAQGAGGLIGVIAMIAAPNVKSLGRVLVACSVSFAILAIVFAFSTIIFISAAASFGLGFTIVWWGNTLRVAMLMTAAEAMRGRVMSLSAMTSQMVALAWFVGGVLSELIGPQATLIAGAVTAGTMYVSIFLLSPDIRRLGRE
jgi:predicted MFS family arabinose efflux permease